MSDPTRRDIETRLERALNDVATATVPAGRPRPPYPYPAEQPNGAKPPAHQPRLHQRWMAPLLTAAALLVVTLGVSAIPALSSHRHQPATAGPSTSAPSPQPSVSTTTPAPSKRPTSPAASRSTVPAASIDPRTIDLANAVIDIPSTPRTYCSAGRQLFRNGVARSAGSPWSWALGPRLLYANLDGQPGDEVLASITCADAEITPAFLLVLKAAPNRFLQTLGLLNTAGSTLLVYDPDTVQIEGNTVLAEVMGPVHGPGEGSLAKQVRGYAHSGGRFVQVSGPTSFPPLPKTVTGVDLSNTTLLVSVGDCPSSCYAWVRFVDGTGTAALTHGGPLSTFTQGPASLARDATGNVIAIMSMRWTTPGGPQRGAAFAISSDDGIHLLSAQPIAMTGSDGILSVQSAAGTPASDVATVVVSTAQGSQTRRYQAPTDYGLPWKRLS